MKPRKNPLVLHSVIACLSLAATGASFSQSIKADNPDALDQTSSWTNGTVPTGALATWDSTITAANTSTIGAGVSFSGIQITNPTGDVAINTGTGGTLTLGSAGIDMATSAIPLTLGSTVSLGSNQTWTTGTSGTDYSTQLTATGVISGSASLTIAGSTTAPRAVRLNGANDFTGDFTVATGGNAMLGVATVGASGVMTSSPWGLGNVTLNNGSTLLLSTNYNIATSSVAAKKLTINGDIALGQVTSGGTLVGTGRLTYGGNIDLGSATRTISLGRAVTAAQAISTNTPAIALSTVNGANATILNGTMRFVLDENPATDTTFTYVGVSFGSQSIWQNDSGVIIGNRVVTSFGSGASFNTASSYPNFAVEAGGYLNLSDGATNARNARIKSLAGAGTVLNCTSGSGTATLTIDGGASSGSFEFPGAIKNNDSTFAGGRSGVVGVTKLGNTTQILSGTNTYTGPTTLTSGKLVTTTKSSNGSYTTSNGTTLGVKVATAGSDLNVTALTLGTTTLEFDLGALGNPTTAVINNGGALTVNGPVTVNLGGDPTAMSTGTFTLITSGSRTGTGTFVKGSLPPGVDATLTEVGNTVTLTINSITPIYQWTGAANNIWNSNIANTNWLKNGTPSSYADAPSTDVVLDDSATGSTSIDVSATVSPKSTTIDATAKTYSLSGIGKISGSGGLTKKGSSSLTVSTPNDYAGNTEITAGTLKLGAANGIPDGAGKGTTTIAGTLDLAGFSETLNGLGGGGQVIDSTAGTPVLTVGNNDATSTFAGAVSGTVALAKTGTGTLTLTGTSGHSGGTTINGGTLSLGNGGTTGALSSAGTLTTNATFAVNRSNTVTQGTDFPSTISGSGGIEKSGTGTLVLNAANNHAGLSSVGAGNLALENAASLGTTAAGTVANGGSILLRNGITVTGETATITGLGSGSRGVIRADGADAEWAGNIVVVSGTTDTRLGGSVTAGGTLTLSGQISGGDPNAVLDPSSGYNGYPAVVSVRSADPSDTVVLSGASNFNGNLGIFVGNVRLDGGNNRLPVTSRVLMGFPGTAPVFDLNGRSQQLAGLYDYQTGTGALATVTNDSETAASLTIDSSDAGKPAGAGPAAGLTPTFSGTLQGNFALVKSGSGSLALTNTASHTGGTTVTGGTLTLGNGTDSTSLDDNSVVVIGASGILNLDFLAANSDTVKSLTIAGVQKAAGIWGSTSSGAPNKDSQITGTGTLTVTVTTGTSSGYDSWKIANAGGQPADLDYDNDGVENGIEYFMGEPGGTMTTNPGVVSGKVTWPRNPAFAGIYQIQYSADLSTWSTATTGVVVNPDSLEYTLPAGLGKSFVRLSVKPH